MKQSLLQLVLSSVSLILLQYVRVDVETPDKDLIDLLLHCWKLKKPNLLISVTGGAKNFHMKATLREVFRRGLIKVSRSTGKMSVDKNIVTWSLIILFGSLSMVRRYPPNPRGTENVFSDIHVSSIKLYVLSLSCLGMGINLVLDNGPRD